MVITDTKLCLTCGGEISSSATFCEHCGNAVADATELREASEEKLSKPGRGRRAVAFGGFALIVGAFLPWVSLNAFFIGNMDMAGIEGDGIFTVLIGVLLLLGLLLTRNRQSNVYSTVVILGALLAIILIISKFFSIGMIGLDMEYGGVSSGSGLYVSLLGGLFAFVGGIRSVNAGKP